MRPAMDVVNRILWDEGLPNHAFVVGYLDRFVGVKEKAISAFNFHDDFGSISHTETAIPQTRIQYLKYVHQDGSRLVWDRRPESRADDFFGSFPRGNGTNIEQIMARHPPRNTPDENAASAHPERAINGLNAGNPDRPNFFVCFRVLSPRIVKRAQEMQLLSPEAHEGALPTQRLHFTMLTLRLRNELELERAREALATFDIGKSLSSDQPIHVRGVDCFRDRVLHARVDPADGSLRALLHLHEALRNHMIAALGVQAWKGQDQQSFVPHMTITKCNREMSRRGAFFHPSLYSPLAAQSLGKVRVRALHLCRMAAPADPSEFYETFGSSIPNLSRWSEDDETLGTDVISWEDAQQGKAKALRARGRQVLKKRGTLVVVRGFACASKDAFMQSEYPQGRRCSSSSAFRAAITSEAADQEDATILLCQDFGQIWEYEGALQLAKAAGFACQVVQPCRGYKAWFEEALKSGHSMKKALQVAKLALSFEHDPASLWFPLRTAGPMPAPQELYVFDFDHTLFDTADPVGPWRGRGGLFVSLPLSLQDEATVSPGPALASWKRALERPRATMVVLTGRKEILEPQVRSILDRYQLAPDALLMKPADTFQSASFKATKVQELSELGFSSVSFFDDDPLAREAVCQRMAGCPAFRSIDANSLRREDAGRAAESSHNLQEAALCAVTRQLHELVSKAHPEMLQVDPEALAIVFGSTMYGRESNDLDVCLICPHVDVAGGLLQTLYDRLRRGSILRRDHSEEMRVLDSHLAKRSKCPRIAMHVQHIVSGETFDVDIVLAMLDPSRAVERFCNAPSTHTYDKTMLEEWRSICVDKASERSLEGAIFGAGLIARTETACGALGPRLLRALVDKADERLVAHGLRGRHLQMIRTFQIAMLVVTFLEDPQTAVKGLDEVDALFSEFSNYLAISVTQESWMQVLVGLHDPEFAECHAMYLPRLIAAFRGDPIQVICPYLAYAHFQIEVRTRRPWKARLQLEAGFPRVLRSLSARGSIFVSGAGQLPFLREATPFDGFFCAVIDLYLAVSSDHRDDGSGASALRLLEQEVSQLRLPESTFARVFLSEQVNKVFSATSWCDPTEF
ncbi:Leukocyte receptor cluster member 9 [Hondaea fermentalgiana]|uniref:Leukocyte receptor cluster member 9 n=1 Tax=Hondaea fermentalgiana TaxID=2315210 RepID=A0A2R5GI69_9STRA|nr:Leukocyte receptor cluster member 9 [Hondaea fermentalgiana]|eukprot:GBG28353.1 Leukocyte receptor cluster member 9 [Hondaea fermentalgiana]